MSEEHFRRWVCEDVIDLRLSLVPVVTLSTVVYPFPLLARNPVYAAHPILRRFAGGGQARIEVLETLLTRAVLRPTQELRERAGRLAEVVRERAEAWGKDRGLGDRSPKVVGLHVRTYFVKAVAMSTVRLSAVPPSPSFSLFLFLIFLALVSLSLSLSLLSPASRRSS